MPLNKTSVLSLVFLQSDAVHCIVENTSVDAAVCEMNRLRIGSLMVKNAPGQVVGIFTERDVLVRVVASGLDAKATPVRDVMTTEFRSIQPESTVEEAMQIMTHRRVRHLPILKDGALCGMLSIGDVTRWLLEISTMEAENLRRYVFADYPG
tara:strand:+ start:42 stop:497 length:456 start_codon:yes stop_codon:yes gene_type:complete